MNIKKIALDIANDLFTNGDNKHADRLILELPEKYDGGGWCEKAVAARIEKYLIRTAKRKRRRIH